VLIRRRSGCIEYDPAAAALDAARDALRAAGYEDVEVEFADRENDFFGQEYWISAHVYVSDGQFVTDIDAYLEAGVDPPSTATMDRRLRLD
jgi:Asp-tRNA(Asn)/Glu-tRNA(Gln) amidotransferase A subunit family amidase